MELVPRTKAEKYEHGAVTSGEYHLAHSNLNIAHIRIDGRYLEKGYTANTISDSVVHIISGLGTLACKNGETFSLAAHDQIHLDVGDAYYFEGELEIIYSAAPPLDSRTNQSYRLNQRLKTSCFEYVTDQEGDKHSE